MSLKIQVQGLAAVLVLLFSTTAMAMVVMPEMPAIEWSRQIGTSYAEYATEIVVDDSGNTYMVGYEAFPIEDTPDSECNIILYKYDTNGNEVWSTSFGTDVPEYASSVVLDGSGNLYITGTTSDGLDGNTSKGREDIFLTKYTTGGTKLWTKQFGTDQNDHGRALTIDDSGNIYLAGYTHGALNGNTHLGNDDVFLMKLNSSGNTLWTQQFGTTSREVCLDMAIDDTGDTYITGYTEGDFGGDNAGGVDMFLTKYNASGVNQWTRQLGTADSDIGGGVAVDNNGDIYVTGSTQDAFDGNTYVGSNDIFVAKYDTNGNKQWTDQFGTLSSDAGSDIAVDSNNELYLTGTSYGGLDGVPGVGGTDLFLAKYGADGARMWTQLLGTNDYDTGGHLVIDGSNNIYLAGYTYVSMEDDDILLFKLSTVPEPGTLAMLAGLAAMGLLYWRKRR
ncbi:MAG: SBBP repeat-containing protein [Planctomycetia bacterium]